MKNCWKDLCDKCKESICPIKDEQGVLAQMCLHCDKNSDKGLTNSKKEL